MQTNPIEKACRVIASCKTPEQLAVAARYAERAAKHAKGGDEVLLRCQLRAAHAMLPLAECIEVEAANAV